MLLWQHDPDDLHGARLAYAALKSEFPFLDVIVQRGSGVRIEDAVSADLDAGSGTTVVSMGAAALRHARKHAPGMRRQLESRPGHRFMVFVDAFWHPPVELSVAVDEVRAFGNTIVATTGRAVHALPSLRKILEMHRTAGTRRVWVQSSIHDAGVSSLLPHLGGLIIPVAIQHLGDRAHDTMPVKAMLQFYRDVAHYRDNPPTTTHNDELDRNKLISAARLWTGMREPPA